MLKKTTCSFIQSLSVILFSAFVLVSCGKIIGKDVGLLEVDAISTEENKVVGTTFLTMEAGEKVTFWSAMDMEFKGDVFLRFNVEVLKNGNSYKAFQIDPTDSNLTIGEVKTSFGNKSKWKFSKKHGSLTVDEAGEYEFKAFLIAADNPSLLVNEAKLKLKQ